MRLKQIGSISATVLLLWLFCTPMGSDPDDGEDNEPTLLRLSLEEVGRVKAEFSGAPIQAIVECDADTFFSYLHWRTGKGSIIYPDTVLRQKAKRFYVQLYWMRYPMYPDTTDDQYYDTVWVSMGGGLKKSNKVIVKVTNLPVVIDSASFDSLPLLGQDTIWEYSLPKIPKPSYVFTVYARDLDKNIPSLEVIGSKGKVIRDQVDPLTMSYQPPKGDFIDSLTVIAYDQMRGQAIRTLIISHMTPNFKPRIDSLKVNKVWLRTPQLGNRYRVAFYAIDTLALRLYAHDTLGSIEKIIWKADEHFIEMDSSNSRLATYVCTDESCADTMKDSSELLDIITVSVIDNRDDTTSRQIEIYKGNLNQAPVIEELTVGDEAVVFSNTTATVTLGGGKAYIVRLNAADPEDEEITVAWAASPSSRISSVTDSSLVYTAPTVRDTDTISLALSDNELTVQRSIVIVIDDILPRFNGWTVGKTTFNGTDTLHVFQVSAGDTLVLIADARDLDNEDEMSYHWDSRYPDRFNVKQGDRAQYILPSTDLNDTIILTLQDGEGQIVRYMALEPVNLVPVVDSIYGHEVKLEGNNAILLDAAITGDTVTYEAYAHDPEGDELEYLWSSSDTSDFTVRQTAEVVYVCRDSVFIDTITLTIEDTAGKSAQRRIRLQIDTVATE